MSKNLPSRSEQGMTIVEVIVVMAILSVIMLAVMSLYIPAQRSTVVQSQVTDIQDNLRLAMDRLSQDIFSAGFLVGEQAPVVFDSGTDDDPKDFTINTRLVGRGFGRIASAAAGGGAGEVTLTLTSADMAADFPAGARVRLFEPVSTVECDSGEPDASRRVYTVTSATIDNNGTPGDPSDDFSVLEVEDPNGALSHNVINPEAVVIRVASDATPPLQTIRYRHLDTDGDGTADALVRTVNGQNQFLARNVSDINFAYQYAPSGRVERIDIELAGETKSLVAGDAVAGAKTRSLQSSVKLRNVF